MSVFMSKIAAVLELFAIAGGLVLLHYAAKEAGAILLRAAGWLLIVGGVLLGLCTTYYWFAYQARGGFEHPMFNSSISNNAMSGMMGWHYGNSYQDHPGEAAMPWGMHRGMHADAYRGMGANRMDRSAMPRNYPDMMYGRPPNDDNGARGNRMGPPDWPMQQAPQTEQENP